MVADIMALGVEMARSGLLVFLIGLGIVVGLEVFSPAFDEEARAMRVKQAHEKKRGEW